MSTSFSRRSHCRCRIASPRYLLEWAALLVVLFILAHLFQLREFTSVLNGTVGSTNLSWQMASFLGAVYIFVYLGFVVVAPILILGAAILKMWQRATAPKSNSDEPGTNPQKN